MLIQYVGNILSHPIVAICIGVIAIIIEYTTNHVSILTIKFIYYLTCSDAQSCDETSVLSYECHSRAVDQRICIPEHLRLTAGSTEISNLVYKGAVLYSRL